MIDEIICIGTSFTYGGGFHKYMNQKTVELYKEKGIEVSAKLNSFPTKLSEISNIKTRNLGKCGASIEYLIRNVEDIFYNEDLSKKIFILEYSNWGRSELYSNRINRYLIANWGPRDGKDVFHRGYESYITVDYEEMCDPNNNFTFDPDMRKEMRVFDSYLNRFQNEKIELTKRDRHFLNLLYKLNYFGVKFYIICLEPPFLKDLEDDKLFNKHLIKFEVNNSSDYSLYSFVGSNNFDIQSDVGVQDGHPSPQGHKKIADIIFNRLKKDQLL
jgi:hypothetical protein